jgi:hypothetical protein
MATKIILGIILTLFPLLFELATEGYRTIVLKRRDRHFLTACIRLTFVLAAGLGNPSVIFWWQGSLLAFSFHYLLFDPLFARWVLHQDISYFGNNVLDRVHKWLADRISLMGLYFLKLMVLASAIKFYIDPYIW